MQGFSADGYIMDQDMLTDYEYRTIRADINGCGPVAVFNLCHALGRDVDFAELLREMDGLHAVHRPGPLPPRRSAAGTVCDPAGAAVTAGRSRRASTRM